MVKAITTMTDTGIMSLDNFLARKELTSWIMSLLSLTFLKITLLLYLFRSRVRFWVGLHLEQVQPKEMLALLQQANLVPVPTLLTLHALQFGMQFNQGVFPDKWTGTWGRPSDHHVDLTTLTTQCVARERKDF